MASPILIITGTPEWSAAVESKLGAEYTVARYTDRVGYVTRLADARAVMVLADSRDPDWRFWVSTPKSSPATRRIPVVVAADDPTSRHDALIAGADLALTPDELVAQIESLVADYGRLESAAYLEELDCECGDSLPTLAVQGVEKFNAHEFYRQHDLFEEQWMHTEGPVRDLYRAILQVGIAYFQIERGNHRGALKMLLRSLQWLLILPDVCQGIDVKQLREDSARVRAALDAMTPDDIGQFDRRLLKPVRYAPPQNG